MQSDASRRRRYRYRSQMPSTTLAHVGGRGVGLTPGEYEGPSGMTTSSLGIGRDELGVSVRGVVVIAGASESVASGGAVSGGAVSGGALAGGVVVGDGIVELDVEVGVVVGDGDSSVLLLLPQPAVSAPIPKTAAPPTNSAIWRVTRVSLIVRPVGSVPSKQSDPSVLLVQWPVACEW